MYKRQYGWWPPDSSPCNDYEDQKSNYHISTYKKKLANAVSKGSCMSIWVDNDMYPGSYDFADEFVQTKKTLKRMNVDLPNALIWIDQLLITKQAYAGIYIGINPKFNANIFSDSQLVVNQVNGIYKIKNDRMKLLHHRATNLLSSLNDWTFDYIPREKNATADKYADLGRRKSN